MTRTFTTHDEIVEAWYSRKYNIFYESGDTKYEVRRIGSTIYCYDDKQDCGKGAVHNFDVTKFYAEEKPIEIPVETPETL